MSFSLLSDHEQLAFWQLRIIQHIDSAKVATAQALNLILLSGNLLEKKKEEIPGNFGEWLRDHQETIGYCDRTARRYMLAARAAAKIGGIEKAVADHRTLCSLLEAAGFLPPRPETEEHSPREQPLFRVVHEIHGPPPEEWTSLQRREYIQQTQPIVDLYMRVQAVDGI